LWVVNVLYRCRRHGRPRTAVVVAAVAVGAVVVIDHALVGEE
jgi:hypothetical protein